MRRATRLAVALILAIAIGGVHPASAAYTAGPFPDVPAKHWAAKAISYVTDPSRAWIPARSEGFGPEQNFTRRELALAMFRVFPPPAKWSSSRTFVDVPEGDPLIDALRWSAWKRWLPVRADEIRAEAPVNRRLMDQALVRALGYARYATAVSRLQTEDGESVVSSWSTGFLLVADRLELHPNFSNERLDVLPGQALDRAHAADIFKRVADVMSKSSASLAWRVDGYESIKLPAMSPARLAAVRFAFRGAGFPYVWAGEWHQPTGNDYPYGLQVQGGFDCTGFAWWVLHQPTNDSYRAPEVRGYAGWNLPWRTATAMAEATKTKRRWKDTLPMDLAFYDFDGDPSRMDHAGLLLGNGWVLHSSGSKGGVTLEQSSSGYMRRAFMYARRVIPAKE